MLAFTSTKIPPSGIKNSAFEPDARKIRPSETKSSAFWPKARKIRPSVTKSSNSRPEYQFWEKTLRADTDTGRTLSNQKENTAA